MKNTKYFALGLSLLFSVCIQSQSVFAQEKAIEIQNEKMIVDRLLTMKGFSLEDLKCVEKEKGSMVYENDAMKVTVENLDLDSLGMQDVSITYSVKSSKALWDKMNHSDSSQVSSDYTITKKVEVIDNEAPVIEAQDRSVITQGDDFDLEQEIKVSDDREQEIDVELEGDIDISTPGTYTVQVKATDAGNNETIKNVDVEVQKKTDPYFYQKIADAALAQIGVNQDCTMLVTNSLKAVGIIFHGAPEAYLSLGTLTNDPVPGDICVYQGHVAIYIGNGQAVHGGWLGYNTVVSSVSCTNPFIGYVHVAQ